MRSYAYNCTPKYIKAYHQTESSKFNKNSVSRKSLPLKIVQFIKRAKPINTSFSKINYSLIGIWFLCKVASADSCENECSCKSLMSLIFEYVLQNEFLYYFFEEDVKRARKQPRKQVA